MSCESFRTVCVLNRDSIGIRPVGQVGRRRGSQRAVCCYLLIILGDHSKADRCPSGTEHSDLKMEYTFKKRGSPRCVPETFVVHLGAEHLLLIQTDGAKGAEIPLSVWTGDWAEVLSFTCSSNRERCLLIPVAWRKDNILLVVGTGGHLMMHYYHNIYMHVDVSQCITG